MLQKVNLMVGGKYSPWPHGAHNCPGPATAPKPRVMIGKVLRLYRKGKAVMLGWPELFIQDRKVKNSYY